MIRVSEMRELDYRQAESTIRDLRNVVAGARLKFALARGETRGYHAALALAAKKLWAEFGMDEKMDVVERADEALDVALREEAERSLQLLVLAMGSVFRAAGAFAEVARSSLSREFGVDVVCVDYGGARTFADQFGIFADKFWDLGFNIPTLRFERNDEADVYELVDARDDSSGEAWRLELRVPVAAFVDEGRLFGRLERMLNDARRLTESKVAESEEEARSRRYAEYLKLRAEFEPDVGGESDVGED